jgi:hypothetical protein
MASLELSPPFDEHKHRRIVGLFVPSLRHRVATSWVSIDSVRVPAMVSRNLLARNADKKRRFVLSKVPDVMCHISVDVFHYRKLDSYTTRK